MKHQQIIKKTIFLLLFILIAATKLLAQAAPYYENNIKEVRKNGLSVGITNTMNATDIENNIQNTIAGATSGALIIITGNKTNESAVIELNIPADIVVVWNAVSEGLSFDINGGGTFEVAYGGKIAVSSKNAIKVENGNVIVSGGEVILKTDGHVVQHFAAIYVTNGNVTVSAGEVSALRTDVNDSWHVSAIRVINGNVTVSGGKVSSFRNTSTIFLDNGNVRVTGGEISATGETVNGLFTNNCYAIRIENDGTVAVTGGSVSASGAVTWNCAIIIGWGLAAYYTGTCISDDFDVWYTNYGIIVEVDLLAIPSAYHETTNGLTRTEGGALSNTWWDTSGDTPLIHFAFGSYAYSVPWMGLESVEPVEYAVRHRETGDLFKTISEAITAVKGAGHNTFTLEVIGDVTETSHVIIGSEEVTIVGAEGAHTVTFASAQPSYKFSVEGGGSLTLGEGTTANFLTILHALNVTDGEIHVNDGILLKGYTALSLSGTKTNGTISGGRIEGGITALNMSKGAQLQEISGGVFTGTQEAVHLSDAGTKIHKISGGIFEQTDANITLHGQAVFVQNESQIDEITGGYFEAVRSNAMIVIRGGRVGEISGGEFVARNTYDTDGKRNAVVRIDSDWTYPVKASIGTVSGGYFTGAHFGMLTITGSSIGSEIDKITGGIFEATVALQNDVNCIINEITGGTIIGTQGMLNAGRIGKIGEQANITGKTSYAIFNYSGGQIDEISGGTMRSSGNNGIANAGTIKLISGGTIIGHWSAINCDGMNKGKIEKITNGVFWGKNDVAIQLASNLFLEPELNANKGLGRYWGNNGVIFNDDNLVTFPGNYQMSTKTEAVEGIEEIKFKYLTLPFTATIEGTVFPFVHYEGADEFNQLFAITVSLKPVPADVSSEAAFEKLLAETPLYPPVNAIYYDGTVFVPGTPKYPGTLGHFDNFGLPIDFQDAIGVEYHASDSEILGQEEEPATIEGMTLGVFLIEGVDPGDYILEIKRAGYIVRWAKIKVNADEPVQHFGHRELIPGDINESLKIDAQSATKLLFKKGIYYGHKDYVPEYDLNADGYIDSYDYYLLQKYINFRFYHYEDTMNWLNEY